MILKYPLDLTEANVDYVVFRAEDYRPNQVGLGATGNFGGGGGTYADIILYMPNSQPGVGNGQQWNQETFEGPIGKLKKDLMTAGVNTVMDYDLSAGPTGGLETGKQIMDYVAQFTSKYTEDMAKGAEDVVKQGGVNAIAGVLGVKGNTALALTKGMIYNPNVELIYGGPQLRAYTFQYSFLAKSEKETQAIHDIIMAFKKWSSPEKKDGMYVIPKIWTINYMNGGSKNKHLNAFKKAALTAINVQDNDVLEMHMSYTDGAPLSTTISLQFSEVDLVTREDHEDGSSLRGY